MVSSGREGDGMEQDPRQNLLKFQGQVNQAMGASRILMGVFGMVFAGAGLCMLGLIWGGDSDDVPIYGKLFGSLICVAFLAFGGFAVFGAFVGGRKGMMSPLSEAIQARMKEGAAAAAGSYVCPSCGAALGEKADVSPMGDVKCTHCGRWFNVHKQA